MYRTVCIIVGRGLTLRRSKVVAAAAAAASSNSESVGFDLFFHKKNSESVGNRFVQTFGFRIIGHNC